MQVVDLTETATHENFNEDAYLRANPDVSAAVKSARLKSGRDHFEVFGLKEGRRQLSVGSITEIRSRKLQQLEPFLRTDMAREWRNEKWDYLTAKLREETRIADTHLVSSNGYDSNALAMIQTGGIILDCGAGSRGVYYSNVVNFEIVDYQSTDVLGVGEQLPFLDGTFDGVISSAVLEHVRDPFRCAREISRVLKPGGELYCCVPFLQPYHGYPHHYFNATAQGIRRLFEDELEITDQRVLDSMRPIAALEWILSSWKQGLTPRTSEEFSRMTVADLLSGQAALLKMPFCTEMTTQKTFELACATVIKARKPQ